MKIKDQKDTIIAPLTPTIGGSISVLRISGSRAIPITNQLVVKKNILNQNGGTFIHGTFTDKQGNLIDEGLVLIFRAPQSYTGEDVIEINSHANPFIVDRIISHYLDSGCRLAEPGEFSKRAFVNGKIDLIQSEAVADLIASKSESGVQNSLLHLKGKLSDQVKEIKEEIIKITAYLELDLDFTEEDIEIISAEQVIELITQTVAELDKLLGTFQHGKIISNGIDVLITGKPNVGKSSLMNSMIGQNRAIVSNIPGTTRDLIQEQTLINNTLIRFMDSAGIHLSADSIESEGMDRARDQYERADVIILTFDGSQPLDQDDYNLLKTVAVYYKDKAVLVANKADKETDPDTKKKLMEQDGQTLLVSAKTGHAIESLKQHIYSRVSEREHSVKNETHITNKRQFEQLKISRDALSRVKETLINDTGFEFAALDMREATNALSEITGEITTDDMLNKIFSSFCIGK